MGKRKKTANMRLVFVFSIFFIQLLTAVLLVPVAFFFSRWGVTQDNPLQPMLMLLFTSLITGTFISGIVSNSILKPIKEISDAARQVAKGDFSVRLNTTQRARELDETFTNFNVMVAELDSIETLRNDFVVNVSHEFKTPLAGIEAYATLLQDESITPEERQEYTHMILDATRQLGTLTGNILKLSKLETSGGMPLEKSRFRLDEQLRQAVLLLEGEWTAKDIDMDVDLDAIEVRGNEELLMQVWLNILSNAVKFTPGGGKIAIALFPTSKGVSVQIEDSGIGMDETVQRHAFEKFYQGSRGRNEVGNGLGLALVKQITQQHGGEVMLQSEEGKGTRLTVRLPV